MEPLFNIGDLVKIKNDFNPIVFIVVDSAEARTNVMYYNHVSGLFVTTPNLSVNFSILHSGNSLTNSPRVKARQRIVYPFEVLHIESL